MKLVNAKLYKKEIKQNWLDFAMEIYLKGNPSVTEDDIMATGFWSPDYHRGKSQM